VLISANGRPLALAVPLARGDNGTGTDLKSINVSRGVLISANGRPLALAVPLPRGDTALGPILKSINVSRGVLIRKWAAVG